MENRDSSIWLKDMIVLGHGAPNKTKKLKGAQSRCACIWSEKTGYCRIYPVPYGHLHDWDMLDVEVNKPTDDGRENTYVIHNYLEDWNKMYLHIKVHKDRNNKKVNLWKSDREGCIKLVRSLATDSFSKVRDNKRSFGIIKPNELRGYLEKNKEKSVQQATLVELDNLIMNQKDYKWVPYIKYTCIEECTAKHPHTSKLVEWGSYQWLAKDPNNEVHCNKVFDNLQINNDEYEKYLLIGNIKAYPKTYIIVKLIRFKVNN